MLWFFKVKCSENCVCDSCLASRIHSFSLKTIKENTDIATATRQTLKKIAKIADEKLKLDRIFNKKAS